MCIRDRYYEVVSIDGDYANLKRTDIASDEMCIRDSCLGILSGNLSGRKFPGWLRESVLLSLQWDLQHFSS